jgi:hypothetical protein
MSDEPHNDIEIEISFDDTLLLGRVYEVKFFTRLDVLNDRQLLWTKENRIGFTMVGVRPGDAVCVFNRAPVPHVLGKVEGTGDEVQRWRFLGDAYRHGLMSGEAGKMDVEDSDIVLV